MEHSELMHWPLAKGRLENKLSPAPRKQKRPWRTRWAEAILVLKGDAVGVRCYDDIEQIKARRPWVSGTLKTHPLLSDAFERISRKKPSRV